MRGKLGWASRIRRGLTSAVSSAVTSVFTPALGLALVAVGLAGCGDDSDEALDVFAAASLADAFDEIVADFTQANPNIEVRLNLAGTATLREQLLDGADGDVFVSANTKIMNELVSEAAVKGKPQRLVSNQLVLAVPAGNPAAIETLGDLAKPDVYVGMCATGVPCGDVARDWLGVSRVSADPDTTEPDVRSLTALLVAGELDVAMIYRTEVLANDGTIEMVDFDGIEALTDYPIAAVDPTDAQAVAFVDYATGPQGMATLKRWGFVTGSQS